MLQVMSKSSHAKGWYAFDSDAVGARSAAALAFKWVMRWRRKGAGGQPPTLNDVSHSTSHHPSPCCAVISEKPRATPCLLAVDVVAKSTGMLLRTLRHNADRGLLANSQHRCQSRRCVALRFQRFSPRHLCGVVQATP